MANFHSDYSYSALTYVPRAEPLSYAKATRDLGLVGFSSCKQGYLSSHYNACPQEILFEAYGILEPSI